MCRFTEDPKAYMKQFLEKLKDARTVQRNYPCIFDDSNVRSLFGMLDVTGKGFITYEQYKQGDLSYMYMYCSFTISFSLEFQKQKFTSHIILTLSQYPSCLSQHSIIHAASFQLLLALPVTLSENYIVFPGIPAISRV